MEINRRRAWSELCQSCSQPIQDLLRRAINVRDGRLHQPNGTDQKPSVQPSERNFRILGEARVLHRPCYLKLSLRGFDFAFRSSTEYQFDYRGFVGSIQSIVRLTFTRGWVLFHLAIIRRTDLFIVGPKFKSNLWNKFGKIKEGKIWNSTYLSRIRRRRLPERLTAGENLADDRRSENFFSFNTGVWMNSVEWHTSSDAAAVKKRALTSLQRVHDMAANDWRRQGMT